MGFMDKLKGAAQQAREELEKRGIDVDQVESKVKGQFGTGKDGDSSGAAATEEPVEERLRRETLEQGRPDPFTLLTAEDVRGVGFDVDDPTVSYADYEWGPRFRGRGFERDANDVTLMLYQGEVAPQTPEDAATTMADYVSNYPDEEGKFPLAGVGDEAIRVGNDMVWVRVGRELFYLNVSRYEQDRGPTAEQLEQLAAIAAGRVPRG